MRDVDGEYEYDTWRIHKEFEEQQLKKAIDKMGTFGITHENNKQIQPTRHDSERVGSPDIQQREGTHLSDRAAQQSSDRSA